MCPPEHSGWAEFNRLIIRFNTLQEATKTPTWSLGGGIKVKINIFEFPNIA
jgi:hypothetical protein